ncbi:MAG: DUF3098 domain-containing protein [Lentisphaeria bacterium]|nr:DUF3098 domain-containing protein [Candidatus Neomarinimicrobiota bacterium]MCF7842237.1 DUF3098 domain-containing protein [Lentisphaeria bacterium]
MSEKSTSQTSHWLSELPFTKVNYALFLVGIFVIALGYILMATGELNSVQSLSLSPVVLLIGYLVIIPVAIMYRGSEKKSVNR